MYTSCPVPAPKAVRRDTSLPPHLAPTANTRALRPSGTRPLCPAGGAVPMGRQETRLHHTRGTLRHLLLKHFL